MNLLARSKTAITLIVISVLSFNSCLWLIQSRPIRSIFHPLGSDSLEYVCAALHLGKWNGTLNSKVIEHLHTAYEMNMEWCTGAMPVTEIDRVVNHRVGFTMLIRLFLVLGPRGIAFLGILLASVYYLSIILPIIKYKPKGFAIVVSMLIPLLCWPLFVHGFQLWTDGLSAAICLFVLICITKVINYDGNLQKWYSISLPVAVMLISIRENQIFLFLVLVYVSIRRHRFNRMSADRTFFFGSIGILTLTSLNVVASPTIGSGNALRGLPVLSDLSLSSLWSGVSHSLFRDISSISSRWSLFDLFVSAALIFTLIVPVLLFLGGMKAEAFLFLGLLSIALIHDLTIGLAVENGGTFFRYHLLTLSAIPLAGILLGDCSTESRYLKRICNWNSSI